MLMMSLKTSRAVNIDFATNAHYLKAPEMAMNGNRTDRLGAEKKAAISILRFQGCKQPNWEEKAGRGKAENEKEDVHRRKANLP